MWDWKSEFYKGIENRGSAADLRYPNNILGNKIIAYRITPVGKVRLQDAYDVSNALVIGFDILIHDLTEEEKA